MRFREHTNVFCGECCGLRYIHNPDELPEEKYKNPGGWLTFVRPWPEEDGFKSVTVETGHGNLYFQFRTRDSEDPIPDGKSYRPFLFRPGGGGAFVETLIEHNPSYACESDLPENKYFLVCLSVHPGEQYEKYYQNLIDKFKTRSDFKIIYESELFYNWPHAERHYPSLILFVCERIQ